MKTVGDFLASLTQYERNFVSYMEKAGGKLQAFILLDGEPVETNMVVAALWLTHHPDGVRVAISEAAGWEISTVFLTTPHGIDGDEHFETMVSCHDKTVTYRSRTLKGAKTGHDAIVKRLLAGGRP